MLTVHRSTNGHLGGCTRGAKRPNDSIGAVGAEGQSRIGSEYERGIMKGEAGGNCQMAAHLMDGMGSKSLDGIGRGCSQPLRSCEKVVQAGAAQRSAAQRSAG